MYTAAGKRVEATHEAQLLGSPHDEGFGRAGAVRQ